MLMNNCLRNAMAIAAMVAGAATAGAVVANPLPADVRSVAPEQGLVDISNNSYPLGVSEIAVTFSGEVAVNPDATGFCSIFVDGSDVAAEELPVSTAYVDNMGMPVGAIHFKGVYTAAGTYNVVIPDGVWLVDGKPSPALDLNYQIMRPYTVSPAPGVVEGISSIDFKFSGVDNLEIAATPTFFARMSVDDYTVFTEVVKDENGEANIIRLTFGDPQGNPIEEITTPDTYTLMVPQGAFKFTYEYEGQTVEGSNFEIVYLYYLSAMAKPAIDPEEGEVEEFTTFTLTMPDGFEMMMVDNMATSYIYPADNEGNALPSPLAKVKARRDDAKVVLYIIDDAGQEMESLKPADGKYVLELQQGLVMGTIDGNFISTDPYSYHYTVGNGVSVGAVDIAKAASFDVFTFNGMLVGRGLDASRLQALPAGFYVINGKKTLLR